MDSLLVIKNKIDEEHNHIDCLKTEIKKYINNKKIPLIEKWFIYSYLPEFLLEHLSVIPDDTVLSKLKFDRETFRRYEIINIPEWVCSLENEFEEYPFDEDCTIKSNEELNELKEYALSLEYQSFQVDW